MVRVAGALLLLLTALLAAPAQAHHYACSAEQCIPIVPIPRWPYVKGPVDFDGFSASIDVHDALAKTSLSLTLSNPNSIPTQVEVALPMPDGAVLLAFNLTWPGKHLAGVVAERGAAQQQYDDAVQAGRDAAILEEAGRHLVRLRLNVGAGEDRVLNAAYVEPVPLSGGARVYRLPLSGLDPAPDALHVAVSVESRHGVEGLRAVGLSIPLVDGKGSTTQSAPKDLQDLVLVWGEDGAARSLLVAASDPTAGETLYWAQLCSEGTPLARDVVFVLDQSGSMAGLKIVEARETLMAALHSLQPADRYSIVTFSNDATPFRSTLVAGSAANVDSDQQRVAGIDATLGTNIDGALQEAFRQLNAANSERLPMVVFLTDGLPTVGVTDHRQIIENARAANGRHAPIVVVPIGLDADQTFLADLALRSGGAFVDIGAPDDAMSDHLGRLMEVLAGAVVKDPVLTITGAPVTELLPDVLPPLYAESCLDVRFKAGALPANGSLTLRLSGQGASGPVAWSTTFAADDVPADIPVEPAVRALWGRALVADLLAQERVEPGPALHQAIIDAAVAYSQLSPYTAWVLSDVSPAPTPSGNSGAAAGTSTYAATGTAAGSPTYVSSPGGNPGGDGGDGGDVDSGDNQTPGLGLVALLAAIVGAAVVLRRRLK